MRSPLSVIGSVAAAACLLVALPWTSDASSSWNCPGVPSLCGMSCSLDPYGTPVYCSNGQCTCASGYDTTSGASGTVCQPTQPEAIGTESDDNYSCPGICQAAIPWSTVGSIYSAFDFVPVHGIAPGGEAFMPVWGYQATQCGDHGVAPRCVGGSKNGSSCATSDDCPGGTCTIGICFGGGNKGKTCYADSDCPDSTCLAVGRCSTTGGTCVSDTDCPSGTCNPVRTWAGCAPDPLPFCYGIQESDEGGFDYNDDSDDGCHADKGCGNVCGDVICVQSDGTGCLQYDLRCKHMKPPDSAPAGTTDACNYCSACVSDFTGAWPYIDHSITCSLGSALGIDANTSDPARIDFPSNVVVVRAPTRFEEFTDFSDNPIDDDYTWDMESPGHELFDTDREFAYHDDSKPDGSPCPDTIHGRIHVEFSSDESIDHFGDDDWGAANAFWRGLKNAADSSDDPNPTRCYVKSFVNPSLTCPQSQVDAHCEFHDPMMVVAGIPSLDCADDPYHGTDEIHPVLAMAVRIQEDPNAGPEKWAFFYRQHGDTGPCGNSQYSRCLSDFKLPLGFPVVPPGKVLTGATATVDWHPWADKLIGDPSPDIKIEESTTSPAQGHFDLTDGTVLSIHLPHQEDGVVGLVTITPSYDDTPPTITCPQAINTVPDLGKCTAKVNFPPPTVSDNCLATASCSPPSGSAFPIGTTMDSCIATDQAGHSSAPCNFNITVTAGNKCPHDQGYWKNHTNWPVSSLTLGMKPYSKAQLLGILNNSTIGDASVILARAEIATLLSLANGSNPTPICATIAAADAALGNLMVPAKIGPKTTLGQQMVSIASTLTSYDARTLTPGCTP